MTLRRVRAWLDPPTCLWRRWRAWSTAPHRRSLDVVLLIALALGFAVHTFVDSVVSDDGQLRNIGGLIGTSVSGTFLLVTGTINLVILLDILSTFRRMRRGELDRQSLEQNLVQGGVLTRAFAGLFKFITASWQMYFVGFLFDLGFDTASEVALLAISAGAATQGLPFVAVVSLPLIFAAGMSLMDMTDGAFMAKAYSWAFSNPIRKIFYNVTMTDDPASRCLLRCSSEPLKFCRSSVRLETSTAAFGT
jgi:high-affinity nickel-transport protein